jgi:uncharacterized protein (TIGR03437 family)
MKLKYILVVLLSLSYAATVRSQVTLNPVPSRVVGHAPNPLAPFEGLAPSNFNPNLVEGRELYAPVGLALDTNASPPILYVSDSGNNRVLAWKNGSTFANGAPADLVIGQPDPFTTTPGGPNTTFSAGLSSPTGLAVRNGDLYVVDSGNNRVLRFPQPFANAQQIPNLIIGQATLQTKAANYPSGKPTANGVLLYPGFGSPYSAAIAFDSGGNLWLTDAGNRRVLRYPSAAIAANPANFPAADFVLGWTSPTDFVDAPARNLTTDATGAYTTTQFYVPAALGFDAAGRLYVADADPQLQVNRVLVFNFGNAANGIPNTTSVKIIGLLPQNLTTPPTQDTINKTQLLSPSGLFFFPDSAGGSDVGVVDTYESRILVFPPYERWTDQLVANPATQVIGQNGDFSNHNANNAPLATVAPAPSAATLAYPSAAVFSNNLLYVADTLNNRVVTLPFVAGSFAPATGVLGQTRLTTGSVNYIEGREFNFTGTGDAGIAIDNSSGTPRLYVADPGNHRVLGFNDLRTVTAGTKADIVIGQPDLFTAVCNYPSGDPTKPAQNALCGPIGLALDAQGNLYVADSQNGRVLRFPQPFNFSGTMEPADLVLGQRDFVSQFTDPSSSTMARPYGLAFSGTNGLVVSDVKHNRVLYFPAAAGAFSNGEAATKVFGQNLFNSVIAGTDAASLKQPHHVACDTSGLIYVADTGNNRVEIFGDPNSAATSSRGASAVFSITDNLGAPHGIYVSPVTGEIWVTDTNNGQAKRYGRFPDQLALGSGSTAQIPAAAQTLALAQDQYGDLVMADFSHRVAIYFPGMLAVNGGSFLVNMALAPGMVASICAPGSNATTPSACITGDSAFGVNTGTAKATSFPLTNTLADTQVLFNGKPTPLYYVSPQQINFVVPNGQNPGDVPITGSADLQVVRASTGQVLAASSVSMSAASPGILQEVYTGQLRQAAVLNQDNTPNSPSNPATRGSVIQIFATGAGFVPGAPPDGTPPQSPVPTPAPPPNVIVGACLVDDTACTMETGEHIKYSGLSAYPGVWQLNVQIPMNTAPGSQVPLLVGIDNIFSTSVKSDGFEMVIAVK